MNLKFNAVKFSLGILGLFAFLVVFAIAYGKLFL